MEASAAKVLVLPETALWNGVVVCHISGDVADIADTIATVCMQTLDLMGYEPSHWNKINIHIGGVYGDKEGTLDRFAEAFKRLSNNCKQRLTLENDDWASAFSVKDLLPLSRRCNIPIVFDFHHHKFCSGQASCCTSCK